MRKRLLMLSLPLAVLVGSTVAATPSQAAPPEVKHECKPCYGCDLVVGSKRIPTIRYYCPYE